jgi:predicted dehydrogenase
MKKDSRRNFIKKSALATVGAMAPLPYSLFASQETNTVINIGVIGLGFGMVNMRKMLEGTPWVHCIALCDVDEVRLKEQSESLSKDHPKTAGNIKLYTDFRELLKNKNIDGVIIATPDHWHTYIYAEACKAGKPFT